jgi:hypothetical protein
MRIIREEIHEGWVGAGDFNGSAHPRQHQRRYLPSDRFHGPLQERVERADDDWAVHVSHRHGVPVPAQNPHERPRVIIHAQGEVPFAARDSMSRTIERSSSGYSL